MIFLEPVSGLANRMRAIDSALALSRHLDKRLHVFWYVKPELNCAYTSLFPKPRDFTLWQIPFKKNYKLRKLTEYIFGLFFARSLLQTEVAVSNQIQFDYATLGRHRNVFLRSCFELHGFTTGFACFSPHPKLRKIIESYPLEDAVGVHIRRTDQVLSIKHSPTDAFISRMQAEVDRDPDTRFFLATDDPREEESIRGAFPGRVISHSKQSLDRNQPQGIQDALIDLYCLSRCRCILGSFRSSFCSVASRIGDNELHIVYRE